MKIYNYIIVSPCEVGTLYLARAGKHEIWSLSATDAKKYDSTKKVKMALAKIKPKDKAQYCAVPYEIIPEPPTKKSKLKNFVVRLDIHIGGYEKSTTHLVMHKKSKEAAISVAIRCECHDDKTKTKPDAGGFYEDACGEFCYSVHSVVEVTPAEAEVLRKHL